VNANDFDAKKYVKAVAPALGIEVQQEWQNSVLGHLTNAANMAAILDRLELDDNSIDLANTFSLDK